jgi:hypothetical protein
MVFKILDTISEKYLYYDKENSELSYDTDANKADNFFIAETGYHRIMYMGVYYTTNDPYFLWLSRKDPSPAVQVNLNTPEEWKNMIDKHCKLNLTPVKSSTDISNFKTWKLYLTNQL